MSSGITRKYAPDDVITVIGTQQVIGLHEGSFIEAERDVETASTHVGADGEVTLVISPNHAGKVKVVLQQSSPLNDYFTTLLLALQNKDMGNAVVPISVTDKNGSTVVSAKQAVTQKPVKISFADKPEGREWTFITGYLDMQPGGESSI